MPGDSIAHWLLRDPGGAWRGHVSLPADERFMSGTSTHLVTVGRDELNASVVRVYSVGAPGAP